MKRFPMLFAGGLLVFSPGCESADDGAAALPAEQATPGKRRVSCSESDCPSAEVRSTAVCSYSKWRDTRVVERFTVLESNSELWPGNVLLAEAALQGDLAPYAPGQLAPVTFSLSLVDAGQSVSASMDRPSLSLFRNTINGLLTDLTPEPSPAKTSFEIAEVHTAEQLALEVGLGVGLGLLGSIEGSFDFESESTLSRLLVKFEQAYYSIDVDPVSPPARYLEGEAAAGLENPREAAFVQSVTYGRRLFFSVESRTESRRMRAAIEAALSLGPEGSLEAEHESLLESARIRAFVVGGSASDAVAAITGLDGVRQYIANGAEFSAESPGAAIGYRLTYLDNTLARTSATVEYTQRDCRKEVTANARVLVEYIGGDEDAGEVPSWFGWAYLAPAPGPGAEQGWCEGSGRSAVPGEVQLFNRTEESRIPEPEFPFPPEGVEFSARVGPDGRLCFRINLNEYDSFNDDELGVKQLLLPWPDWSTGSTFEMTDGGETARVSLEIELRVD